MQEHGFSKSKMKDIKKIEIDGEKINLAKSKVFGWGVVYPIFDEDKTLNWFNLLTGGSWIRLLITIFFIIIIFGFAYEYTSQAKLLAQFLEHNITVSQARIINLTI